MLCTQNPMNVKQIQCHQIQAGYYNLQYNSMNEASFKGMMICRLLYTVATAEAEAVQHSPGSIENAGRQLSSSLEAVIIYGGGVSAPTSCNQAKCIRY